MKIELTKQELLIIKTALEDDIKRLKKQFDRIANETKRDLYRKVISEIEKLIEKL